MSPSFCINIPKFRSRRRSAIPEVRSDPAVDLPTSPTTTAVASSASDQFSEKRIPSTFSSLAPSPGAGWGKVVSQGKNLRVTWGTASSRDEPPPQPDGTTKLADLRQAMQKEPDPLHFYIIPSEDAHQSEYVAAVDKRREYISNFTGTAGVAIVSAQEAHLFVDSRYWVQAAKEIDQNWTLHRVGKPGEKTWLQWIKDSPPKGSLVGVDSRLISIQTASQLTAALTATESRLKFPRLNLVDVIRTDRPAKPSNPVLTHELKYAGEPADEKIKKVREWIKSLGSPQQQSANADPTFDHLLSPIIGPVIKVHKPDNPVTASSVVIGTVVSALDSIAWLLNLRGSDVPFNPVFFSYLVITQEEIVLFLDTKVGLNVENHLRDLGVQTKPYGDIWSFLRKKKWDGKMVLDPTMPYAIALMLTPARYTILSTSYIPQLKGIKNKTEIEGFRAAYLRDGASFVRWFAWLEEKIQKDEPVTEWGAAQKLTEYRVQNDNFRGLAYENISATGANAALPHYVPSRSTSALIQTTTPYLNDSGGQYLDGTCDTTRTVHFGDPTQAQKDAFTRVLQGHIAIDSAIFPQGTSGAQLDVLARRALWKNRQNYGHGTGHGFGAFLNVHEGPHAFSNTVPLQPGAVITNEPGFYKEGEFGIRIESALVVRQLDPVDATADAVVWLGFERFTQVPIQTSKLINWSLLSEDEKQWLQEHNDECQEKLTPLLEGDKRALKWLKKECTRLP